jgi:hypothetical protein
MTGEPAKEGITMEKPKGSIYISIGSIGMIVLSGIGILLSPFLIIVSSWIAKLFREIGTILPGHARGAGYPAEMVMGRFISGIGIAIGIIVLVVSGLQLAFGILTWKKKDDLVNTTFPLAVGIAFAALALPMGFTALGLIQLAFPILLIVGATLNRQQGNELRAQAHYHTAQQMTYLPQSPIPIAEKPAEPVAVKAAAPDEPVPANVEPEEPVSATDAPEA